MAVPHFAFYKIVTPVRKINWLGRSARYPETN
jgi:hypothetical protein